MINKNKFLENVRKSTKFAIAGTIGGGIAVLLTFVLGLFYSYNLGLENTEFSLANILFSSTLIGIIAAFIGTATELEFNRNLGKAFKISETIKIIFVYFLTGSIPAIILDAIFENYLPHSREYHEAVDLILWCSVGLFLAGTMSFRTHKFSMIKGCISGWIAGFIGISFMLFLFRILNALFPIGYDAWHADSPTILVANKVISFIGYTFIAFSVNFLPFFSNFVDIQIDSNKLLNDFKNSLRFAIAGGIGGATAAFITHIFNFNGYVLNLRGTNLVLFIGMWTGIISSFIGTAILSEFNRYLGKGFQPIESIKKVMFFSFIAGTIPGIISQVISNNFYRDDPVYELVRIVLWIFVGICLGCALSFRIPNLNIIRGSIGGGIGGFIGCILFTINSLILNVKDTTSFMQNISQMIGFGALGFSIGLMLLFFDAIYSQFSKNSAISLFTSLDKTNMAVPVSHQVSYKDLHEKVIKSIKNCPFCAEEILAEAIKCKHCGEWLNKDAVEKHKSAQITTNINNIEDIELSKSNKIDLVLPVILKSTINQSVSKEEKPLPKILTSNSSLGYTKKSDAQSQNKRQNIKVILVTAFIIFGLGFLLIPVINNEIKFSELRNEADSNFKNGYYDNAKVKFKEALKYDPENDEILFKLDKLTKYEENNLVGETHLINGEIFIAKSKFEEALKFIPEASSPAERIKQIQESINLYNEQKDQADQLFNEGKYTDSKEHYESALQYNANDQYIQGKIDGINLLINTTENTNNSYSAPVDSNNQTTTTSSKYSDINDRIFAGAIGGKIKFHMTLNIEDSKTVKGSYFYDIYKKDIPLSGSINGEDYFVIDEFDPKMPNKKIGSFKGRILSDTTLSGTWFNADETKSMPFEAK